MSSLQDIEAELQRRGLTTSSQSVFDPEEGGVSEFKKFGESLLKGSAKGIVSLVGGWGNLYDYLKGSKDPNAFSSAGIANAINNLTGINIQSIPGYRGAYEFGEAGAPAAALTAVGVPGLFGKGTKGTLGEFGVSGTTGVVAQQVAPESPLSQLALQMSPYAAKGGLSVVGQQMTKPTGLFPSTTETGELTRVGRLTPGQLGLSREQLATEARISAEPSTGALPSEFKKAQAYDVESFLTNLFNKTSGKTLSPSDTIQAVVSSFNNYGKSLSSKLRSDAAKDFSAAKNAGGLIDTTPVVSVIQSKLGEIPTEVKALDPVRNALQKIIDEYAIPATPSVTTPSAILGPTGAPASVTITPATPASNLKINIDRLQKNLSAWGEAAYSGKADFGKGNIFEGVAPGQAKGIAISVLNGFKNALDEAINAGVPGADKLVDARDKFRQNIQKIEQFSDRPLTKAFDVQNVTDLVPEVELAKLKKMPQSQQQFLVEVMQNSPNSQVNEVLNTIRRMNFDDVLSAAQTKGGAISDPTFNISVALKELDKKSSDFANLFPNAKDAADARLAMNWMRRTLESESAAGVPGIAAGEVYGITGALGGSARTRLQAREIIPLIRDIVANPKAFADVIYNPEYRKAMLDLAKPKTTLDKAIGATQTLGKALAIGGVRAGPMLETIGPEMPSATQETAPIPSLMEYESEMKARGLM